MTEHTKFLDFITHWVNFKEGASNEQTVGAILFCLYETLESLPSERRSELARTVTREVKFMNEKEWMEKNATVIP